MWIPIEGYQTIGRNEKVCGGNITIIGTRLEPSFIQRYMINSKLTKEEIMLEFNLTEKQVDEMNRFCSST